MDTQKRTIKFRAWDKTYKKMLFKDPNYSCEYAMGGTCNKHKLKLMQYTGLKDKSGVEIYEGDILRSDDSYSCIVEWWDESYSGRLICKEGHSCEDISYALNGGEGYEVIGNIWENSNLLEVDNGKGT